MATDTDVTADALSRALGTLFNLGQAGIDWASVARAVLAFREEERQRWLDANDELAAPPKYASIEPERVRRQAHAGGNAAALFIEVQAGLLACLLRTGRDWQRLLQDCAPPLQQAADAYQAEADAPPAVTEALINQVVIFTQVVGEFFRDQGAQLERELLVLQDEVLGRGGDGREPIAGPLRRPKD
ncbi:hypothetical protein HLB44_26750 [Aquincola sp. S2]|uniref:Uncharacterized protein n=1 Tax=Pseudaquabacterium terrae TaxID=2732868 RepID=A0ABX2EPR6_9BURK|nr:hypothetical protein [Aquabacterium terrae]NRF70608.1 hypothetical protein [Aquabacterium terrae]